MHGAPYRAQSWAVGRTEIPVRQDQEAECHKPCFPRAGRTIVRSQARRRGRQPPVAENGNVAPDRYRPPPATWSCRVLCSRGAHFRLERKLFATEACLRVQPSPASAVRVRRAISLRRENRGRRCWRKAFVDHRVIESLRIAAKKFG